MLRLDSRINHILGGNAMFKNIIYLLLVAVMSFGSCLAMQQNVESKVQRSMTAESEISPEQRAKASEKLNGLALDRGYWRRNESVDAQVKELIDAGADIDAPYIRDVDQKQDGTALTTATFYADVDLVRALLRYNANPFITDDTGQTALQRAKRKLKGFMGQKDLPKWQEIVQLLEDAEAARIPAAPPAPMPNLWSLISSSSSAGRSPSLEAGSSSADAKAAD
jgi:hypothetical protein